MSPRSLKLSPNGPISIGQSQLILCQYSIINTLNPRWYRRCPGEVTRVFPTVGPVKWSWACCPQLVHGHYHRRSVQRIGSHSAFDDRPGAGVSCSKCTVGGPTGSGTVFENLQKDHWAQLQEFNIGRFSGCGMLRCPGFDTILLNYHFLCG